MTPKQINNQIARAGSVVLAWNNIAALRDAARLAGRSLPVRWSFEPGTPDRVVDYLAGGASGALEGAAVGLGVEVLLAALFPAVAFGYAVAGFAAAGAYQGANRVRQGWRVRVVHSGYGEPMLEVRLAA